MPPDRQGPMFCSLLRPVQGSILLLFSVFVVANRTAPWVCSPDTRKGSVRRCPFKKSRGARCSEGEPGRELNDAAADRGPGNRSDSRATGCRARPGVGEFTVGILEAGRV